jgi:hypothetical protein
MVISPDIQQIILRDMLEVSLGFSALQSGDNDDQRRYHTINVSIQDLIDAYLPDTNTDLPTEEISEPTVFQLALIVANLPTVSYIGQELLFPKDDPRYIALSGAVRDTLHGLGAYIPDEEFILGRPVMQYIDHTISELMGN